MGVDGASMLGHSVLLIRICCASSTDLGQVVMGVTSVGMREFVGEYLC